MNIGLLSLTNFRNYEKVEFRPSEGLNVLFGLNAQGKSAMLEAVYLLATSKSHRTSKDMDLIRLGETTARVYAEVNRRASNDITLEVILDRAEKKIIKINTVRHPKIGDIAGQLNAVIFSSADIDMVRGEPSLRRRFLNLEIAQISPRYVYSLGRYKRVLDQRNNLLRELKLGRERTGALEVWDEQLAVYGAEVIDRRVEFTGFLAAAAARVYRMLTQESEELSITYKTSLEIAGCATQEDIAGRYAEILHGRRELDVVRGTTTTGPHRDDLVLSVNGLSARDYASQGQQRSVAVAMKLAEIELIRGFGGREPRGPAGRCDGGT